MTGEASAHAQHKFGAVVPDRGLVSSVSFAFIVVTVSFAFCTHVDVMVSKTAQSLVNTLALFS